MTLELVISHQYRTVACTRIWTSLHGTYIPASSSSSNVCPLSCTHNKPEKIAYANKSNLTTFFTTLVSHIVRRQVMIPAFQSSMYNYELRRLWSYTDSCIITRLYADSEEPFFFFVNTSPIFHRPCQPALETTLLGLGHIQYHYAPNFFCCEQIQDFQPAWLFLPRFTSKVAKLRTFSFRELHRERNAE